MGSAAGLSKLAGSVDLAPFKELLLRTCGHSFEKEREQALSAGLCRRMASLDIDSVGTYFSLLKRDNAELLKLTELLTVNETYFFREPDHLNLIVNTLLPEFMTRLKGRPLRILSAGCSTGEEPYTIAIMLRERFGAESERMFSITAVDIDSSVIATAKQGIYGRSSFRGINQSILERYFEPAGQLEYKISYAIKKLVGFEVVNLLGGSYPERMQSPEIILYRNVSIYFPSQVQREIFGRLAELLADGGCLFVGASETIHHDIGILSLVKQDSLFFYRKTPPLVFEERRASSRFMSSQERSLSGIQKPVAVYNAKSELRLLRPDDAHTNERGGVHRNSSTHHDVKEQFDLAIEQAHKGLHEKALSILDSIIEQDKSFEKAYVLKGSLLLSTSRFDDSRAVCEGILERDSLCLEAYLMLGMTARQKGDDAEAIRRFREAIYLNPSCWLAHFYSAEILFVQKDVRRAKSGYDAAARILEKGSLKEHGQAFFPLTFNADQFIIICRHKLSLLANN